MMKQLKVRILENKKIAQNFYRLCVRSPYLSRNIKPGQFIQVRCSEGVDPLLRRPFSVHRILKSGVEILYEVIGKGTEILSQKKTGEILDVIGPLGNGFKLNHPTIQLSNHPMILIAGGIGVAPLVALAEELAYSVERIAYRKRPDIYVIIGAKRKNHILCEEDFRKLRCEILVATEDGSKGKKGLATDLLRGLLNAVLHPLNARIYACGPNAMLKEVAEITKERNIPCQVSLEEYMACGVGVCLGCPVKVKNREYKMVCKDGPIFDAGDIIW